MTKRVDRAALARARTVIATRGSARRTADLAFQVYAGFFVMLIVGIPIVRTLVLALAEPSVVLTLTTSATAMTAVVVGIALALLAAAVGGVRGAIVPRPAYVQFVVGSPLQRQLTLRRPLVFAHVLLAGSLVALVAILCGALAVAGIELQPALTVAFLAVAGAYGILLVAAWLLGQTSARLRSIAGVALVVLVAVIAVTLTSGAMADVVEWVTAMVLAATSVHAWVGWGVTVAACVAGGGLALVSSMLLTRLRGHDLMTQGQAWASAGVLAQSGDVRGSIDRVRMPARHRPTRVSLRAGGLWWLIVKRDAAGSMRHPVRVLSALLTGLVAGGLVTVALSAAPGTSAVGAASAGLLGYLSAGPWSDGVRAHADNVGAPALFGASATALALMHLVVPIAASCTIMIAGALASLVWLGLAVQLHVVVAAAVLSVALVVLRAVSAAKGPLPVVLLLPVPTPMGDMSILFALVWAFDGVLIALLLGVGAVWLAAGPTISGVLIGGALVIFALLAWARARLTRLMT